MNHGLLAIYILIFVRLLLSAHRHGKPYEGTSNFWIEVIVTAQALALIWWALGWRFF